MAQDRNELLLRCHRSAGFSLMEMQDQLLLFTDRTRAHSKFVGAFAKIVVPDHPETCWPIRAIWAVCDFEMGASPIDYDKLDLDKPGVMDRIEHGVFSPEIEELLPIAKGRLKK